MEREHNIVAIVQARMGSRRLPGKVLADIAGEAMLGRVVARAWRARTVNRVVVATSDTAADDAVEAFCGQKNYAVFRGSESRRARPLLPGGQSF
jgi:spore coat polysaccharide biosynthesis protein SpsF